MSDAEFAAFLAACRRELASLQPDYERCIQGGGQWSCDLSNGTLRVGDLSFRITPIGTYSTEYRSWLWAWANDDFPLHARETSKLLQKLYTLTGFRVFTSPGIRASATDADDFVAVSVHTLGAIGFFRVPSNRPAPSLFLAIHEPTNSK